jgi:hypothetical protein
VHLDVKKLGRIPPGGGWRAHSRLAYAEILDDERGPPAPDSSSGPPACRDFQAALAALGARHKRIRPHCPWQNGKVKRFNRTLATKWAYRTGLRQQHRTPRPSRVLQHSTPPQRARRPAPDQPGATNVMAQYT